MGFRKRELGKPHLSFEEVQDTGKTKIWVVYSTHSDEALGGIRWYWARRRYLHFPNPNSFYDVDCLRSIANFIAKEMRKRKAKK